VINPGKADAAGGDSLLAHRLHRFSVGGAFMKALIPALLALAVFAGCAHHSSTDPSASTRTDKKVACENAGGKWKPLTHHCDMD
jgi:hypothetical protein